MSRKNKSRVKSSKSSVITAVSVSLIGASGVALAGPTGGNVVGGSATIAGTTIDGKVATLITQSTNKAVINWDDFSIPAAELVKFAQNAGNGSVTLNRVTGNQLSNIQGALEANGNIFLINPNGIMFGAGATVDVAGLLASTLDVTPDSFMNGDSLSFNQVGGKGLQSIQNQGRITVGNGGFVYLVAPKVDNSGYVMANVGTVTMAAGNRFNVDLSGNGLINFNVSADALGSAASDAEKAGVSNSGTVSAQHVLLAGNQASNMMSSVVNSTGIIEATDLDITGADIVQGGTLTATGTANLKATNTIKTPGASTRAATLNLEVTADGASIGAEDASLRVDADVLNAKAANGHVLVTDVAGGVALGEVTTGIKDNVQQRRVILKSEGGNITSADPLKTNVSGWSANLVADGSVGTDAQAVTTSVDVLTASTQNGGINIQDLDGELAVGAINAREAITVNGTTSASTAFSDADGKITLSNGAVGTKNVKIKAKSDLFLTDSVTAGNALTLTSEDGNVYSTSTAVQLTGKTINLNAGAAIGVDGAALKIQSETLNAMALNGGVYLNEGKGLTIGTVSAAGIDNNVSISVDQGDIKLGSIDATGGKITLTSTNGAITDNNAAAMNLKANELALTSTNAMGTAAKSLDTSANVITAKTSAALAGIYLANATALTSLTAGTSNGDTKVDFTGGQFAFNRLSSQLSLTGYNPMDLAFSNAAGNIVVNGLDIGPKGLSLSSSGAITQVGTDAIVAQNISLKASGNIGATGTALNTNTQKLGATSTSGIINVNNTGTAPLSVNATANGANGAVNIAQQGDLSVDSVIAKNAVSLTAGGQLIAGSGGSGINVTAASMSLSGASVGTDSVAFVSSVVGPVAITSNGDINARNTGAISLLDATAGGKIVFNNSGDVSVGTLQAGGTLKFAVSGNATDGNGAGVNFTATGLDVSSRSFGTSSDALELHVDSLTIDTASGAIYASNLGGQKLSLIRATSGGSGSNVSISNEGDIDLGVINAGGNNVVLSSSGTIEDARVPGSTEANVSARNLDIRAPGGIGNNSDLALDVSFLSAAGGTGGVKASNAGAIAVDSSTLVGKGLSEISIIATDITVLNNNGGTITMDGGKLVMTATTGNIVFLNQNDTIYLPGGGSITLTAMGHSDLDGYNGAIVAGNLKTDGGDIKLQAQSNITIGMLNAGSGDVSVLSNNGIILDGNGSRENIVGNHVTLKASTPSFRDAELSRDTAIADYAAKVAEANAKLFDLNVLIQQLRSYESQVQSATVQKQIAAANEWLTQVMVDAQQARVDSAESVLNTLNSVLKAATVIRNAAAFIAGAAQAVPFSGDAGADAIFAGVDVAMSIADIALDTYERYTFDPMAGELDTLNNQLDLAKAVNVDANSNLAMASLIRDTVQTSKDMADLAVFKINTARDASEQIRRQAVAAYDLNKDIDSSASKPLGITANRLDVNAGGTLNTSLYLDTQGHLGLGDIALAVGQQIVAKAAQDLSVVGTVNSDTAITLKAGGAILGAGGTLVTPALSATAGNGIGMNQAVNTQVSRLALKAGTGGINVLNRTGADLTVGAIGTVQGATGAGNITLDTDGSLIVNNLISDTSGTHDVTLNSGGAIVDGNGTGRNVQGNRLFVNARNGAELDTEVAEVTAQATAFGNLTLRDASDLIARNLQAATGNLNIQAAGNLTAGALGVNTTTGSIALTAGGRIDDDQNNSTTIIANQLTLTAARSIGATGSNGLRSLDTHVNRVSGSAGGEINIAEQDDLNIGLLETDRGNVTVTSTAGSLNVDTLRTGTEGDTLSLVAANQITNARTDAASNLTAANMTLSAGRGIGANRSLNIEAQRLEADGGTGGINLTDLNGGLVIGDVTPNLGNTALEGLHVTGGDLRVQAKQGNLGFEKAVINDGNGNIALAADGSILLNHDVTGRSNIAVNAGGTINQNVNLQTNVGNITVASTGGDVTMADGVTTRVNGAGNVNYSAGGDLLISRIDAQQGNVALNAQAGSIVGQDSVPYNVASRGLVATAAHGIGNAAGALKTKVDTLIANVTDSGSLKVSDVDALQLTQVSNANGPINVTAGGDITAADVSSVNGQVVLTTAGNVATTTDGLIRANDLQVSAGNGVNVRTRADAATISANNGDLNINEQGNIRLDNLATTNGNVVVNAGGQIGVNSVQAGNGANNVNLTAGGAIVKAGAAQTLAGDTVNLSAGSGIGNGALGALAVDTNHLNAQSAAGDVRLSAAHGLAVDNLVANNGNLDLVVNQGDARVGTVYASGQASLNAAQGSLVDDGNVNTRITADTATLSAAGGIGSNAALQTQANTLVANASNGAVNIDERDGLNSLTVNSPSADVNVTSANGNIVVNSVQAAGHTVSLATPAGAIRDARNGVASVTAERLLLNGARGVGQAGNLLDVAVHDLSAQGGTSGVYVNNLYGGTLKLSDAGYGTSLKTTGGDIYLATAGALNVAQKVSNTGGGNITLKAGGSINQGSDITGVGAGNISVTSGGDINMANGVKTSTGTGTISYNAKGSLGLGQIETAGRVVFVAPSIVDNMPGVSNIKAWVIDLDNRAANTALVTNLVGESADAALIRLDYRPVGGSLMESRRFMDELLKPVGAPQHASLVANVMDVNHGGASLLNANARLITDSTNKSLVSGEGSDSSGE